MKNAEAYIRRRARRLGLDPDAVVAVASVEGYDALKGGVSIGDNGTSYGPFQLHVGGALPRGKGSKWAHSRAGIDYALRQMAKHAKGLRGRAAVEAIVFKFERPAAPGAEVEKAMGRYRPGTSKLAPNASTRLEQGGTPGMTIETPNPPDLAGVALSNLGQMSDQKGHYDPLFGLSNLVQAIAEAGSTTTTVPGTPAEAPKQNAHWNKYVRLAPGADREGAHTQKPVKQFVGRLGARLGRPLTITTGTNHSQMTVNGNVSAHWSGHGADIAMSGAALTRAGRQALILAGMDPKKARKIKGGLFNIGGYQIIFNTREGGNHYDHLHIGLRGR